MNKKMVSARWGLDIVLLFFAKSGMLCHPCNIQIDFEGGSVKSKKKLDINCCHVVLLKVISRVLSLLKRKLQLERTKMEKKSIWSWIINVNMYVSAFICALRIKNKAMHIIAELLYGVIVLFLPVLFISLYLIAFAGGETADLFEVIKYVAYIGYGIYVWLIFTNRKQEKKIEDYILIGSLYWDEYIKDKDKRKKKVFTVILELFGFLFFAVLLVAGMVGLLEALQRVSEESILIGSLMAITLSYIVFVYGCVDVTARTRRKTVLGVLLFLIWTIVVGVRLRDYWQSKSDIELLDMVILFFSAVFTIPTLYGWVKGIPKQMIEPYGEAARIRKDALVDDFTEMFAEWKSKGGLFVENMRSAKNKLVHQWKKDKWRDRIIKVLYMLAIIAAMIFVYWASKKVPALLAVVESEIKNWYANLEAGVRGILDKILVLIFLFGVMIYFIIKAPKVYKSKNTIKDKVSCIVGVILVEVVFGFAVYMVLF